MKKDKIGQKIIEMCRYHAKDVVVQDLIEQAQSNEEGLVTFSNHLYGEDLLIHYKATAMVPLTKEYQRDADDYYFIDAEEIIILELKVESIEIC